MAEAQRELEILRARERHGQEQIALIERRLADAETAGAERGARVADLERELREIGAERDGLRTQNAELQRINAELSATAEHFRSVNDGLMTSLSWRMTRPLRALKPRGRA